MLPIFPSAYFGSIAYFRKLASFHDIIIEVHEHFPKQTLRNRCEITGAQGVIRLTLPVNKPNGTKTPTHDVLCSEQEDWKTIHLRTITTAYAAAPFFEHYISDIESLFSNDTKSLITFNYELTQFLLNTWGIETKMHFSKQFEPSSAFDFRSYDFVNDISEIPFYQQVCYKNNQVFNPTLSALDLLFCEGPMGRKILL